MRDQWRYATADRGSSIATSPWPLRDTRTKMEVNKQYISLSHSPSLSSILSMCLSPSRDRFLCSICKVFRSRFFTTWRAPFWQLLNKFFGAVPRRTRKGSYSSHKINIFDAKLWFSFVLMSSALCPPLDTMQIEVQVDFDMLMMTPTCLGAGSLTESNWICIRHSKMCIWNRC